MAERDSNENEAGARRDDDAAFAAIVAAYGEEPPDPPGAERWPVAENLTEKWGREDAHREDRRDDRRDDPLAELDDGLDDRFEGRFEDDFDPDVEDDRRSATPPDTLTKPDKSDQADKGDPDDAADKGDKPVGSFIVFAPGVGPRDWDAAESSEEDFDETDEGHFVPPEPPPLPESDTTSRFAWLGVLGGPLLLLGVVLFQVELTWWITTLGVGGFLGGFVTLVMRMQDSDDEEDDDPGRGAVV
ncbi:hypothetical protein [Streptomyces sp. Rer75]|uniref:hypothetical protein n=1 Tax=unclassified Streptomyces TaxID=2593676 RepID=UPI0015CFD777|nr:hypothetical protein [Streptomyces sp. Rer75]QLH21234.1 hypothetical protein HYQ63_11865 [Streptomyces sp. Rer75]